MKKFSLKIFFYTALSLTFFLFPQTASGEETGFRFPSTCTTNGTSCENMREQDDKYNSWVGALYREVLANFADFGIPTNSIIDEIQVKIRMRTFGGDPLWGVGPWTVYWSDNSGNNWYSFRRVSRTEYTCIHLTRPTGGTFNSIEFPSFSCLNNDLLYRVTGENINSPSFIFKVWSTLNYPENSDIDILLFNIVYHCCSVEPTPTPTPTPTPSPTPTPGPAPFLDLPWDYEGKGLTFNEAALNPVSWFDHQYPLQNVPCCIKDVLIYSGKNIAGLYKSHNGYDYGLKDGVELNTPVLAAASGIATFKSKEHSGGAGNVIKIDHGNGYQTWYEHLGSGDLIVSKEGASVPVAKGQMIGRVGMTGNTSGPHIHLSVFKDANDNGIFDDDYPYGVVDPLGWEGESIDPWVEWSDGIRTGTESFNLFIPRKAPKSSPVPTSGATIAIDDMQIAVPSGAFITDFTLTINNGPFEFVSDVLGSVVPSLFLDAVDSFGKKVTEFLEPIQITYSYEDADLFNINEDTLNIYFLNPQTNQWESLSSFLNKENKTITGETTHFSHFALMGEVKDKIAPTTEAILSGNKGEDNWYRSSVTVGFNAKDNDSGVGLQYTLYTINGDDWFEYKEPLVFENEGKYNITYQSIDKAENTEDRKTITFHIDKTPPEVSIDTSPKEIWPPNGKMTNVTITGFATDDYLFSKTFTVIDEYDLIEPAISDFSQTIQLEARRDGSDKDGRMYIIEARAEDMAGNITEKQTQVLVPHDQGKKK